MTPEQELELLVSEQQADDTYFVDRPPFVISLDAPAPHGEGTVADYVGRDEEGELVSFIGATSPALSDVRSIKHGTIYAYRRLECRCRKCRTAQSEAVAAYRARRRAES